MNIRSRTCLLAVSLFLLGLIPALVFSEEEEQHKTEYPDLSEYRIICISPALGQIVYALGLGNDVVGLGQECMYLAGSRKVKNVGKFGGTNLEALVELSANLILTQSMDDSLGSFYKNNDVQVLNLSMQSITELYATIREIGIVTKREERGRELIAQIQGRLEAVRRDTFQPRPTVFISIARAKGMLSNILTAGRATFISELLRIAGGENVFGDTKGMWPQISRETLLTRSPEVIIELIPYECSEEEIAAYRRDWQEMPELEAVKTGSIYYICARDVLTPSIHIADTAEEIHKILEHYEDDR